MLQRQALAICVGAGSTTDKARRSSAAQGRAELHSWRQGASQVTGFALVKRRAQQQRHALQLRALRDCGASVVELQPAQRGTQSRGFHTSAAWERRAEYVVRSDISVRAVPLRAAAERVARSGLVRALHAGAYTALLRVRCI